MDEEANEANEGRVLLFNDRLVFVAKDGSHITIPFLTIRNIRIRHLWLIWPVGLEFTDDTNQTRVLVVGMPYYWKGKIRK